ncbi:DUF2218 domain-containing protein [Novosphingobium flavum]|uniref:DUF2218 domain-containing protein n=1 Tax=Novosphingobium flavum TaxID=1778672 RepID=A0A7X1FUR7_9SPHN|nr:DUF2218 domain-containing protein [Novosphingobium flavum]MBC2666712.1 DUF2218 domain-containing protein [Novosphingobium flavum]
MPVTTTCFAPCEKASRYLQQLVSHWSHRMAATWNDGRAEFPFSDTSRASMEALEVGIVVTLTTADGAENETMRGVIERHLDRFAFREAPLSFQWSL